jgi:hypothetical protein
MFFLLIVPGLSCGDGEANRSSHPVFQPSASTSTQAGLDRAVIAMAHATGASSCQQIAEQFGIHFTALGKVVRRGD